MSEQPIEKLSRKVVIGWLLLLCLSLLTVIIKNWPDNPLIEGGLALLLGFLIVIQFRNKRVVSFLQTTRGFVLSFLAWSLFSWLFNKSSLDYFVTGFFALILVSYYLRRSWLARHDLN
ncbi:MAG TPA: hypothetical protein VGH16_23370 [Candidatus Binatia bacterium]|jgi:hypothetical protein